jgi:hypothetical protein
MTELQTVHDHLEKATCPEDIFGVVDESSLKVTFRQLAMTVHPDRNANDPLAAKAFQRLNQMNDLAATRLKEGTWGKRLPLPGEEPFDLGKYSVARKPIPGDIADIYVAKDVVVKVARSADDGDLLRAERTALEALILPDPVNVGVPQMVENFTVNGVGGWKREANVLTRFPGFLTAEYVHGVMQCDARTVVWMFKRLLVLLEHVHKSGYIHGAILPPHVLFYPDNDGGKDHDARKHSLRLIDWCYAVEFKKRTRLSSWVPQWASHYPPEVKAKKSIGPASDLYMAAWLIEYLTHGYALPPPLNEILHRCEAQDPAKRYQTAGEVFDEWMKAAQAVFGAPKWAEFNVKQP